MEDNLFTSIKKPQTKIKIFVDPEILSDFETIHFPTEFQLVTSHTNYSLLKLNGCLRFKLPNGELEDYPYYLKNIEMLLNYISQANNSTEHTLNLEAMNKLTKKIEKKLYSSISINPKDNIKDLWNQIVKKIYSITTESHGLSLLVEKILQIPFFQNFESSLILIHIKGQSKAELLGAIWKNEKVQFPVEVSHFNHFFSAVKKSKIKSFATENFPALKLPFYGKFLAKEVTSKIFNLVFISSRHDFLAFSKNEIELFEMCMDLLVPHFERLIDQEFSNKRIAELRLCIKEFPIPVKIKSIVKNTSIANDQFNPDLQDTDVFFTQNFGDMYTIELYDCDQLRQYAFDLFHFQRISLLGELLNTLRHELSNPLFGLRLGAQLFSTLDIRNDDESIMKEIDKNIERCQLIIENFSNLYQAQGEVKSVTIDKLIYESILLSKSETREVRKKIILPDDCKNILLNVPAIFVVQILFNLFINAAQAMRSNLGEKLVLVKITKCSINLFIDVVDNGPGVPEEHVFDLFKPFFTTKSYGTGLGLLLSRNMALKMGGNLEYLNNNTSTGAHFRLSLPLK